LPINRILSRLFKYQAHYRLQALVSSVTSGSTCLKPELRGELSAGIRITASVNASTRLCELHRVAFRWYSGKTPMQAFLDAMPLAKEKMIAA
jgi:TRAP-type mannitol/chloroaromatic compound transport system substrate-binding protein